MLAAIAGLGEASDGGWNAYHVLAHLSVLLLSNDRLDVDQPIPFAALIDGLADDHIPRHTQNFVTLNLASRLSARAAIR